MIISKKTFSILFLATGLHFVSPMASAGKIENPTMEEVTYAIETTVKYAEEALEALKKGEDKEVVLEWLKKTKQIAKEIEVTRLGPQKMKASSNMKKARFNVKRDEMEKAEEHISKGLEYYYQLRKRFYDF